MPKCNVTIKGGSVSRGDVFQCNNNETRYCQRDVPPNIGIKDVVLQLQWFTKKCDDNDFRCVRIFEWN